MRAGGRVSVNNTAMSSPASNLDGKTTLAQLDAEFDQIGCLGHGGFGSVFLARKRRSGRRVAIKSFRMDLDHDGNNGNDEPESFTRELETVLRLNDDHDHHSSSKQSQQDHRHVSIVFFEDWYTGPGFAWIVMNYVDGGTLAQEIESKSLEPYTERRIAWYALQLSEALAFAHERGVTHNDVKSANVLIDRTGGGKLLLADFGSAGEEIDTMTEIYAAPEFQQAHANDDDFSNLEPEKLDAFGLGCILFEMLSCQKMVHLTGDQTLAEFLLQQSVDAALQLPCIRLPWLPPPHATTTTAPLVGYSDALRSLVKTLLEPDPAHRWTPSALQKPLRQDPQSPLLADRVVAAQTVVPGTAVTVDNVQLGMLVQRGRDWEDEGTIHGSIGVVVQLDPDAGYAQAVFPSRTTSISILGCYRIGAGCKFELKVGLLVDYFGFTGESQSTTGMVMCDHASTLSVGQLINDDKGMVVSVQHDRIFVVPTQTSSTETLPPPVPTAITESLVHPCRKPGNSPPETWQPDRGLLVPLTADDSDEKRNLVHSFYSLQGGMDIQSDEILAIHRVQSMELWSVYAHTKEDVAGENWGVANEQRLFHGTGRFSPEVLLKNNPSDFYLHCHSGEDFQSSELQFSQRAKFGDQRSFRFNTDRNTKQMVVSRVALGRVRSKSGRSPSKASRPEPLLNYHSEKKPGQLDGTEVFTTRSSSQAFVEYIITYRSLPLRRPVRAKRPGQRVSYPPSSLPMTSTSTSSSATSAHVIPSCGRVATPPDATNGKIGQRNTPKAESPATKMCVVCLSRPVCCILLPCGHPCLCQICSTEQGLVKLRRKCPECRTKVEQAATFYGRVVND